MSTQTLKKRTIGIAIAAVGAAAITLGAGTFAFFSVTAPAAPTTATAGTLTLTQSVTGSATLSGFVPGIATQQNSLTLTTGGLAGKVTFANAVSDTEDGCDGDEGLVDDCGVSTGDLSGKLQVTVTRSGFSSGVVYTGSVAGLATTTLLNVTNVPANTTMTYTFVYNLPDSGTNADNAVQGDSATVTTTATLTQS